MRGIAEQRHAAAAPVRDGLAIAEDPHFPRIDLGQHLLNLRVRMREELFQFAGITVGIPTFLVTIAVEDGDEVKNVAAMQRVMDEVVLRAAP